MYRQLQGLEAVVTCAGVCPDVGRGADRAPLFADSATAGMNGWPSRTVWLTCVARRLFAFHPIRSPQVAPDGNTFSVTYNTLYKRLL